MISSSTFHPQENEYLRKVGLSVQLVSVNTFGGIPMDQATEQTAIKHGYQSTWRNPRDSLHVLGVA